MASDREGRTGMSAWWAVREVDHLFARLGRYTRFVLYGKWSLVILAGLLVVSLIMWPLLSKDRSGVRVSFVDTRTAKGAPTSPVMANPEFSGTGTSGNAYTVNGKTATQKTPNLVVMDAVDGKLVKPDGSWQTLTADRADYQQDKKIIDLYGNATVIDVDGNTFVAPHATIETQTSRIYGNEGVIGTGPKGNIVARGFEIRDDGAHIIFTRGDKPVHVTVDKASKKK